MARCAITFTVAVLRYQTHPRETEELRCYGRSDVGFLLLNPVCLLQSDACLPVQPIYTFKARQAGRGGTKSANLPGGKPGVPHQFFVIVRAGKINSKITGLRLTFKRTSFDITRQR